MNLPPSKLGTQEYWDRFYETEIRNFKENPNDTGECWFDDSGAEDKMVEYVEEHLNDPSGGVGQLVDLGTGNGHLLFALHEAGVKGEFLGIDYSPASVAFATQVAQADGMEDIKFEHVDFLNNPAWTSEQFDLVLDKGTLDAIALSTIPEAPKKYAASVVPRIRPGGRLLITSCNFTKPELTELIGLPVEDEIRYPSFTFGGQQGTSVVTLVFCKPRD